VKEGENMPKFLIKDNMIPGIDRIAYNVRGYNVWGILWSRIDQLARNVLEISGSKIYPKYYYYEDAGVPHIYRYYTRFRKKWDEYTSFWIDFRAWGTQHPQTNEGDVGFRIRPELVTEFNFNNFASGNPRRTYLTFFNHLPLLSHQLKRSSPQSLYAFILLHSQMHLHIL